jgi:predicted ATPase
LERKRRELALLLKLGPPVTIIKGAQSPEAEDVYRRAREHAVALEDQDGLFKGTWGLWYNANIGRRLDLARTHSEELMALGRRSSDDDLFLEALHCRWSTAQFRDDNQTALAASEEGARRYDPAKHAWMGPVFGGHDPGVCALIVQATGHSLLGRCSESTRFHQRSIDLAEKLGHANNRAHALLGVSVAAQIASDHQALIRFADAAFALADKYGLPPVRAHALFMRGAAMGFQSDLEAGVAAMEAEFARASAVGPFGRYYAALLATGQEKLGRFESALEIVGRALETVTEPGVGLFVSELHRLKGMCLLQRGRSSMDDAMSSLRAAVGVARAQHATLLEVRAATSLARAAINQCRGSEDVDALRTLCASLPSTFDAPELHEAEKLLSIAR